MVALKNCVPFMPFVGLLRGILDGAIPAGIVKVAAAEPTTFSHLRVDLDAVKAVADIGLPDSYFDSGNVTARMVVLAETINWLGNEGILETVRYKSGNGLVVTGFSKTSVKAFIADHISFRKLARNKVKWEQTEQRVATIAPVYDFGGTERIYRRTDLSRR
jgi:hypothetical protein